MEFAEAIRKPRVDDVSVRRQRDEPATGSLALTGHHLIFSSTAKQSTAGKLPEALAEQELWVCYAEVGRFVIKILKMEIQLSFTRLIPVCSSVAAQNGRRGFGAEQTRIVRWLAVSEVQELHDTDTGFPKSR